MHIMISWTFGDFLSGICAMNAINFCAYHVGGSYPIQSTDREL